MKPILKNPLLNLKDIVNVIDVEELTHLYEQKGKIYYKNDCIPDVIVDWKLAKKEAIIEAKQRKWPQEYPCLRVSEEETEYNIIGIPTKTSKLEDQLLDTHLYQDLPHEHLLYTTTIKKTIPFKTREHAIEIDTAFVNPNYHGMIEFVNGSSLPLQIGGSLLKKTLGNENTLQTTLNVHPYIWPSPTIPPHIEVDQQNKKNKWSPKHQRAAYTSEFIITYAKEKELQEVNILTSFEEATYVYIYLWKQTTNEDIKSYAKQTATLCSQYPKKYEKELNESRKYNRRAYLAGILTNATPLLYALHQ